MSWLLFVITLVRTYCTLPKEYYQLNSAFLSAGMHALGLMDRVWIVAEFSMFNQCGSDLGMIFFVNASTILQFYPF